MNRTKFIKKGKWRTIESFWNAKATAVFQRPEGAQIKIRYGAGWFGFNRQKQTLDGFTQKTLSVGWGSIARARMQIKVSQDTNLSYEVHAGGIALTTPGIDF